jgi:transposase-like protein
MLDVMDNTRKKRLLATECSEPERSEGERNGGANNAASSPGGPDPEVSAKPKRRRFTSAYKARIVEKALACTESGEIGALLRREGLYWSALTLWRRQYQAGALKALNDTKRGPKRTCDARDVELQQLRRDNARLTKKLKQAEAIIDIQKKIAAILSDPIETPENTENIS